MRVVGGKIVPCSTCLRARRKTVEKLRALAGRAAYTTLLVQCEHGDLTIDAKTSRVTAVQGDGLAGLIGLEVYVAGKTLYNLETADPLTTTVGRIVKVDKIE